MRAARCSFPPGVGHERHFHAAHWGYIVQGATMRITTAAGIIDRVLKAGDSARYAVDLQHSIRNTGKGAAKALLVVEYLH